MPLPIIDGHGVDTTGGSGGQVIIVNTSANDGPGSLREAFAVSGPRIIIPIVKVINLTAGLFCDNDDVTLNGGPMGGVEIRGDQTTFRCSNVIVQGMIFRPGNPINTDCVNFGAVPGVQKSNFWINHCAMNWSQDEATNFSRWCTDATISDCIIAEALHFDSDHPFGPMCWAGTQTEGGVPQRISYLRNLIGFTQRRNPQITHGIDIEFINNYCCGILEGYQVVRLGTTAEGDNDDHYASCNIIANHIRDHQGTVVTVNGNRRGPFRAFNWFDGRMHVDGNICEDANGDPIGVNHFWGHLNPVAGVPSYDGMSQAQRDLYFPPTRFNPSNYQPMHANLVRDYVLANAGPTPEIFGFTNDAVLARILSQAENFIGVDGGSDVAGMGGYPTPPSPPTWTDTDGDGVPDDEEGTWGDDVDGYLTHFWLPQGEPPPSYEYPGFLEFTNGVASRITLHYDEGGEGTGYHTTTGTLPVGANDGGRTPAVVGFNSLGDWGYNAPAGEDREWLQFTIIVDTAGDYRFKYYAGTTSSTRAVIADFYRDPAGVQESTPYNTTGPINTINTLNYQTVVLNDHNVIVPLEAGRTVMRLTVTGDTTIRNFILEKLAVGGTVFVPLSGARVPILDASNLPVIIASGSTPFNPSVLYQATDVGGGEYELVYRGVTLTFDEPVWIYDTRNGDPVIFTDTTRLPNGCTFTVTPASQQSGGFWINGAELNPIMIDTHDQGFDQRLADNTGNRPILPYVHGQNVDPGATGAPFDVPTNFEGTFVKAISAPGWLPGEWKPIQEYVCFTFVKALPPSNGFWFRPDPSSSVKTWPGKAETIIMSGSNSPLRELTAPSGLQSVTDQLADIATYRIHTIPFWHNFGEHGRRMQPRDEPPSTGYSATHGRHRAEMCLSLNIDPNGNQTLIDDRLILAVWAVQCGIDVDGAVQQELLYTFGAGQHNGFKPFGMCAGFMLRRQDIINRTLTIKSNCTHQPNWTVVQDVGKPGQWNSGNDGGGARPIVRWATVDDVGTPDWQKEDPSSDPFDRNWRLLALYRETWLPVGLLELMCMALYRNSPQGSTGDVVLRQGGANNNTNPWAAALAYMDRTATWSFERFGSTDFIHPSDAIDLYDDWRDEITTTPRYLMRPDVPEAADDYPVFVAGGSAGEIDYDFTQWNPRDHSTQTITARMIRVSQDIVVDDVLDTVTGFDHAFQWKEFDPEDNLTGTISGLRHGTPHFCAWQQENASGWSEWSPAYQVRLTSNETQTGGEYDPRALITTPGTASGGLVKVDDPVLLYKPYPGHLHPTFEPVTDAEGVRTFYAGMGYWTGGTGSLLATFQWQMDDSGDLVFVNIVGATNRSYTRTGVEAGNRLRCMVTVNGVSAASNTIAIPAKQVDASGVIIDTQFDGEFATDYPTIYAEMLAESGGSWILQYYESVLVADWSPGVVHFDKSGSHPTADIQITGTSPEGPITYELDIGIGDLAGTAQDVLSDTRVRFLDGLDAVLDEHIISASTGHINTTLSGSFEIAQGSGIRLEIHNTISTGGSTGTGGGPYIGRLYMEGEPGEPPPPSISVIQIIGDSSGDIASTSQEFTIPASPAVEAGDRLILVHVGANTMGTPTPPDGFSQIAESSNDFAHAFAKVAEGDEAGETLVVSGLASTRRAAFVFLHVRGATNITALTTDGLDAAELTPAGGSVETAWLSVITGQRSDAELVQPSGYTFLPLSMVGATGSPASGQSSIAAGAYKVSTAASENPETWAVNSGILNNPMSFIFSAR